MRDPELKWMPSDESGGRAIRVRAISVAVLTLSCLAFGILIGRLTVAPVSKARDAVSSAPTPNLALKSDSDPMHSSTDPAPREAELNGKRPPVVLLNPGTADPRDKSAAEHVTPGQEPTRARPRSANDGAFGHAPRAERNTDARDYRSLRQYMLDR